MPAPRLTGASWQVEHLSGAPLGPGVVSAPWEQVAAAIDTLPADLDWRSLADRVIPVFRRVRPYHASYPEPVRIVMPPGISISIGIDIGPAFMHVDQSMLDRWAMTAGDVASRALVNLDRLAARVSPKQVIREKIGGTPVQLLQSGSASASTFVLLPDSLSRLFGREPKLLIAPMQDLLISLPVDVDREFAGWLYEEIAASDPNCLTPMGFLFREDIVICQSLLDECEARRGQGLLS